MAFRTGVCFDFARAGLNITEVKSYLDVKEVRKSSDDLPA